MTQLCLCKYTVALCARVFTHVRETDKIILTWSRRRGWWTRRGRWWLQTPGHIGWVETGGEEQKLDHLLLPQPPHYWNPASETESEGWKTERERDIYCLPTVKAALQVKMANMVFVWEEEPWLQTGKGKQHLCKAATEWKHEGFSVFWH